MYWEDTAESESPWKSSFTCFSLNEYAQEAREQIDGSI